MPLKRHFSVDAIDTVGDTEIEEPFIQASKRGRKGGKGKSIIAKKNLSQPTQSTEIDTDIIPNQVQCIICNEQGSKSSLITCESCDQSYHLICCGVEVADHQVVIKMVDILGWTCKICRDDRLQELKKLRKDLAECEDKLKNKNQSMHSDKPKSKSFGDQSQNPQSNKGPDQMAVSQSSHLDMSDPVPHQLNYANVVKLVRKSVLDVNHRKRNVVVSGLRESNGGDDGYLFTNLCVKELGVRPVLQPGGARRLGKAMGVNPRKLLIRLSSEDSAFELIKIAKRLRTSTDGYIASKVYINPDLSKDEAKLAFDRRQVRRQTGSSVSGFGTVGVGQMSRDGISSSRGETSSSLPVANRAGLNTSRSINSGHEIASLSHTNASVCTSSVVAKEINVLSPSVNSNVATPVRSDTLLNPSAPVFSLNGAVVSAAGLGLQTSTTDQLAIPASSSICVMTDSSLGLNGTGSSCSQAD